MKKELYYVTSNPGKFAEVSHFIQSEACGITLKQHAVDIPEIQTIDQMAIAIDKAKKAWDVLQKPLLVDDAAMYFDKYHKFPGTMTKFVAQGIGFQGLKRLIDLGDRATFLLYLVYMKSAEEYYVFEGTCSGTLVKPNEFTGDLNLPFDVFFMPDGADITYADMRDNQSHYQDFYYRIRALKQFLSWYNLNEK